MKIYDCYTKVITTAELDSECWNDNWVPPSKNSKQLNYQEPNPKLGWKIWKRLQNTNGLAVLILEIFSN